MLETLLYLVGFLCLALSSRQIGGLFSRVHLPLITGYLLAGVLVGPFGLDFLTSEAIPRLRFVDEVALAVIAFTAGSEFYLAEMRSRMRSVTWVTTGLIVATFLLGATVLFLIADRIPVPWELSTTDRLAVAVLGATILVTRSPSSAVAIIRELRAKGPFTKTVLGVTVVMDVAVIVLFGFTASLAAALLTGQGMGMGFVALVLGELALALVAGLVLAKLIQIVLALSVRRGLKVAMILVVAAFVFRGSDELRHLSAARTPFEVLAEPLLICMVASFVVTNYSRFRQEFSELLHDIGPPIFVAFFTLTGASMELDVLFQVWPIALGLVVTRLVGIAIGTFTGGVIAGDPMQFNRIAWMGYITQAGIGLGLAKEVADEFPSLGTAFATIFISVIVVNQLIGPPFFKLAIRRLGEAHDRAKSAPDDVLDVLILGIEGPSISLARQLQSQGWTVTLADTDADVVPGDSADGINRVHIPEITSDALGRHVTKATDALVAMLHDDEANLRACELAYQEFGIPRLIVRLNDPTHTEQFRELGVLVVDPTSAMVSLLDRFVRSPWAARLIQQDPLYDTVEVTVSDPDLAGRSLRQLRLPEDVLVLSLHRSNHWVVPHGHTVLRQNDRITLMGSTQSLEDLSLRFEA